MRWCSGEAGDSGSQAGEEESEQREGKRAGGQSEGKEIPHCTQVGFGVGSGARVQVGLTQQLWLLVGQDLVEDVVVPLRL